VASCLEYFLVSGCFLISGCFLNKKTAQHLNGFSLLTKLTLAPVSYRFLRGWGSFLFRGHELLYPM